MDAMIGKLADFGVLGVMAALMVYEIFYLQKKLVNCLITIIENNTIALTELRSHCSKKESEN